MKKLLWATLTTALAAASAWSQENIFSTDTSNNSVSVSNAQTLTPLPPSGTTAGTEGPNTIGTGAGSAPRDLFYDATRKLVYVINSGDLSISTIDPMTFVVTKKYTPPNAGGNFSESARSADGRFLYVAGGNTSPSLMLGIYRFDLDDLSDTGTTFIPCFPSAGATTGYQMIDLDVVPGKIFFTYQVTVSGIGLFISHHIGEFDLVQNTFTDIYAVSTTSTTQPHILTRMAKAPDNSFLLVAATASSGGGTVWEMPRINPSTSPSTVDVVSVASGSANAVVDDVLFTSNGPSPFTVCILARNDSNYAPRFFTVDATGTASAATSGAFVPNQFGGEMTPDFAHNRIFVSWNGNTSTPNGIQIYSPPTALGTFVANAPDMGGPAPQKVCVAPAPPPLKVDFATEPAADTANSFQVEMHGSGFIPGSSRGRITIGAGAPIYATTTTVLSSGALLATFPKQATVIMNIGVVNNDGQVSMLSTFFEGMNPPVSAPFTVDLPPLTSGYSLLSFPQYANVGDLRAGIASQLGPYNPILFRLFLWQGSRYFELNDPRLPASTSIMGTGFFALSRLGDQLTLSAPDVNLNTPAQLRVVVLEPGWNIVSQPWLTGSPTNSMPFGSLQISQTSDLAILQPPGTSPALLNAAYELVNGQYVTSPLLTAGKAYWMLNLNATPIYLQFNNAFVTLKATRAPIPSSVSATPPAPPGQLGDSGGGGGGCGLLGPELLLVALFLRGRGRRKLAA